MVQAKTGILVRIATVLMRKKCFQKIDYIADSYPLSSYLAPIKQLYTPELPKNPPLRIRLSKNFTIPSFVTTLSHVSCLKAKSVAGKRGRGRMVIQRGMR